MEDASFGQAVDEDFRNRVPTDKTDATMGDTGLLVTTDLGSNTASDLFSGKDAVTVEGLIQVEWRRR
ncbi:MAG: hypothetical protein AB1640_03185 [bacterium]